MKVKKSYLILILLIIFLLAGCLSQGNSGELKLGKYVLYDTAKQEWAFVLLKEDSQFEFSRSITTSYNPTGSYEVKSDKLILNAGEKEVYKFSIYGERLILEDDIGSLLPSGSVFEYKD